MNMQQTIASVLKQEPFAGPGIQATDRHGVIYDIAVGDMIFARHTEALGFEITTRAIEAWRRMGMHREAVRIVDALVAHGDEPIVPVDYII